MRYRVVYNYGCESPWLTSFENALALAKEWFSFFNGRSVEILTDQDDYATDTGPTSALTPEQHEQVWEHLR